MEVLIVEGSTENTLVGDHLAVAAVLVLVSVGLQDTKLEGRREGEGGGEQGGRGGEGRGGGRGAGGGGRGAEGGGRREGEEEGRGEL